MRRALVIAPFAVNAEQLALRRAQTQAVRPACARSDYATRR